MRSRMLFLTGMIAVLLVAGQTAFGWDAKTGDRGFDTSLRELNVQAEADMGAFAVRLGGEFGMDRTRIDLLIRSVDKPADAYMVLRVGQIVGKPMDAVLAEYQANKGRGWGVIAKNLGIKPGSPEFHELKKIGKGNKGKGKGHGKGQGHGDNY